MHKEKDVLLTDDEKGTLFVLIRNYEQNAKHKDAKKDSPDYKAYLEARGELEEFFDTHGFKMRFPSRDEIVPYDLSVAFGMFVNDQDIDKGEIQIRESDKNLLEANIMSINRILNDYNQETPWTDSEMNTVMTEAKDMARRLQTLLEKLKVFDLNTADSISYFERICLAEDE